MRIYTSESPTMDIRPVVISATFLEDKDALHNMKGLSPEEQIGVALSKGISRGQIRYQ